MAYWKETVFPDYEISSTGLLRNKNTQKILKPAINSWGGYCTASMSFNGKQYKRLIHRLVAIAFIENPKGLAVVDHIDRCVTNNNVENLRWVTKRENYQNCENYENAQRVIKRERKKKNGSVYTYFEARIVINGKKFENCFSKKEDAEAFIQNAINS